MRGATHSVINTTLNASFSLRTWTVTEIFEYRKVRVKISRVKVIALFGLSVEIQPEANIGVRV
jgi:hypothetical protein